MRRALVRTFASVLALAWGVALRADGAYIVWTDVIDGSPQLRGARFGRQ